MAAPVTRMASATLSGREAAREHVGHLVLHARQRAPVERRPVAAGERAALGRRAHRTGSGRRRRGSASAASASCAVSTLTAFITGLAQRRRTSRHPLRALLAVQLQQIRIDRRHDGIDERIVRVHHQRHDPGAPARPGRQRPGRLGRQVARARRKEHQPDVVGAPGERRLQRSLRPEPADLDFGGLGHRSVGGPAGQTPRVRPHGS